MFKKQLYSWQLGAVLLLCTLFYCVNIYYEWIYPIHTTALFGFVFFLWLGAQLHYNWEVIERKVRSTPYAVFILVFVLALALSSAETRLLFSLKSSDPFNTLRISNVLYSLSAFALLIKIRDFNLAGYFKPRETTYGIYLVHYIVVFNVLPEILIHLDLINPQGMSVPALCVYQYGRFLVVYLVTLLIVKGINNTRFKWIIGNNTPAVKN